MVTRLPDQYLWARYARVTATRGAWVSCGGNSLIAARRQANRQERGVRAILKGLGRALVMSAAAASVIGLAAAPALAASTWTVKPGGSVTGTAGKTIVTDATKKLSVTCTSSVAKGTLKGGKGLAGAGIGTFTSLAFKGCAVGTITVAVSITGMMPLNAISYSAGVSKMTLTKIHGTISVSAISCSATIDGTGATAHNGMVQATFSNATNTLTVSATGGNLHIYNPSSGCTGAVGNKDAVNWTGAYKFNTKQTITSP
jgi:hypothetical protein